MRNEIKRLLSFIEMIPLTLVSADLIARRVVGALCELLKVKQYRLHTLDHSNKEKSVWSFQMPVLTKLFVKYYTILYPSICHIAFPREPQFVLEKGFFCKREKKDLYYFFNTEIQFCNFVIHISIDHETSLWFICFLFKNLITCIIYKKCIQHDLWITL